MQEYRNCTQKSEIGLGLTATNFGAWSEAQNWSQRGFQMENFEKITAPTIKELFVQRIANLILSGRLAVGERLPSERALAEQMGISKTVVHGGLEELSRIGLVRIKPQSGVTVADYMVTGNLETFNAIVRFTGSNLSPDIISAIFDMRLAIEGFAMKRFAACHTQEDILTLRKMIDEIGHYVASDAMSYTGLAERFFEFHFTICRFSRSPMLPLTMNAVREGSLAFWETYIRTTSIESALNLLSKFVDLFAQSDGDGAYALMEAGLHAQLEKYRSQTNF